MRISITFYKAACEKYVPLPTQSREKSFKVVCSGYFSASAVNFSFMIRKKREQIPADAQTRNSFRKWNKF